MYHRLINGQYRPCDRFGGLLPNDESTAPQKPVIVDIAIRGDIHEEDGPIKARKIGAAPRGATVRFLINSPGGSFNAARQIIEAVESRRDLRPVARVTHAHSAAFL